MSFQAGLNVRIEKKIRLASGGHWIWMGSSAVNGRVPSIFSGGVAGKSISVVRYLYNKHIEQLDRYMSIGQTCDLLGCVSPFHYAVKKPRKLSEADAESVRKKIALSRKYSTTYQKLAIEYGVSRQTIEYIVNNKTHKVD